MALSNPQPFYTDVDFGGNQAGNLRLENRTTTFGTPLDGMIYFDSQVGVKRLRYVMDYSNGVDANRYAYLPRTDLSETVSGLWTFSRGVGLAPLAVSDSTRVDNLNAHYLAGDDGSNTARAASSGADANTIALRYTGGRLKVGTPSDGSDAVNLDFLHGYTDGVKDQKDACQTSTTAALVGAGWTHTAANTIEADAVGAKTLDDVALTLNLRVLVKDEAGANQAYNGLYYVAVAGDAGNKCRLVRAVDADSSDEVSNGLQVWVTGGTVGQLRSWILKTADPITLETTNLQFTQNSGAGTISQGKGIVLDGATIHAIQSTDYTTNGVVYATGTSGLGFAALNTSATKKFLRQYSSGAPSFEQVAFADLSSTPTTLSGYGITDGVTTGDARLSDARTPVAHTHALSDLTDYGAAGGYARSNGTAWTRVSGVAWADLTGVPSSFTPSAHMQDVAQGGTNQDSSAWQAGVVILSGTGTWSHENYLALGRGGTAANLTADNGAIAYSTGSALALLAHVTTAGKFLLSGNAAAPTWSPDSLLIVTGSANYLDCIQATSNSEGSASDKVLFLETTTAATSNTFHRCSPWLGLQANIWNGSASVAKQFREQVVGVSGTNSAYYLALSSTDVSDIFCVRGDTGDVTFAADVVHATGGFFKGDSGGFSFSGGKGLVVQCASTYGQIFGYDYTGSAAINLVLNEYGGNVLIGGTTDMASLLSVAGRLNVNGNPTYKNYFTATKVEITAATDFAAGTGQLILVDSGTQTAGKGGLLLFAGPYSGDAPTFFAGTKGCKENSTSGNYAGALVFAARPSNGDLTEYWRLTSTGVLQASGSQTIATTSNGDLTLAPNGTGTVKLPAGTQINGKAAARGYAETLTGDGSTMSFTLNHGLGTQDVVSSIRQNGTPYAQAFTRVEVTDANNVTVKFNVAPASGTNFRVVVVAVG